MYSFIHDGFAGGQSLQADLLVSLSAGDSNLTHARTRTWCRHSQSMERSCGHSYTTLTGRRSPTVFRVLRGERGVQQTGPVRATTEHDGRPKPTHCFGGNSFALVIKIAAALA